MMIRFPAPLRWPVTVLGLCLILTGVRAAKDEEADLSDWWKGPVRYLLGPEEIDTYKDLPDDDQRRAFVLRFWEIRDPTPRSPENEYRARFWQRVKSANYLFRSETSKPGWRTDRGKIYILLGAPDQVRQTPFEPGTVSSITWTYQSTQSVYSRLNAVLVFIEDTGGEFRLQSELTDGALGGSALGRAGDLQALQKITSPSMTMYGEAKPLATLDPDNFLVHSDFYKAQDGNTFVALTVGLSGTALAERFGNDRVDPPRVNIFGRVVADAGRSFRLSGDHGFTASRENDDLDPDEIFLFQSGLTVPPGEYTTFFGIHDWDTGNLFTFRHELSVPDFRSSDFAISSITLARTLERSEFRSTSGRKLPFVLGGLRVVPRPDENFLVGEEFAFYYQIYNARRDVRTDAVDVDVTYRFSRRNPELADAPFEAFGDPRVLRHLREPVIGHAFHLDGWPEADYRLQVTVTDNVSGRHASGEATFQVR